MNLANVAGAQGEPEKHIEEAGFKSQQGSDHKGLVCWQPLCVAAAAKSLQSLQSCPTLCDPMDSSPPGSPVPGILQARTLEWVAISFSNA